MDSKIMSLFLKKINLKGKTTLITGATKGFGRGTAQAIAEAGGDVIAIGRNQSELNSLGKIIKKLRVKYTSFNCDVNNFNRIKSFISKLKKLDSQEYFFDGYIARFDIRYQFTSSLNLRVISEYNEFSDQFFVQPLISWRPNSDTIFYFGGNQNYIDEFVDYNSPNYRVNKSQLFLKFQYLIKS